MTESEIYARLTALHAALAEKLGAEPWCPPVLAITASGKCQIVIYRAEPYSSHDEMTLHYARSGAISATFADAEAYVAAMLEHNAALADQPALISVEA